MNIDMHGMEPVDYWDSEVSHWLRNAATEESAGRPESAHGARVAAGMAAINWLNFAHERDGGDLPADIREQFDFEQAAHAANKPLAAIHHRVCSQMLALKLCRPDWQE